MVHQGVEMCMKGEFIAFTKFCDVAGLKNIYVVSVQVIGKFPSQRPVTQSFDVFFDLCLNKHLSKQS